MVMLYGQACLEGCRLSELQVQEEMARGESFGARVPVEHNIAMFRLWAARWDNCCQ